MKLVRRVQLRVILDVILVIVVDAFIARVVVGVAKRALAAQALKRFWEGRRGGVVKDGAGDGHRAKCGGRVRSQG
jgi:hypothetical protein